MLNQDSSHILIVDDDKRINQLLAKYLNDNGFFTSKAKDSDSCYNLIKKFQFDLIILDIMLPGDNGIEITRKVKIVNDTPIIMLTALGETEDRILGLETGADDYLAKPFEPKELILRIKKILARTKNKKKEKFNFADLEFDLSKNILLKNQQIVNLTSGEAKLLSILIENEGKIMSRESLAQLCGGINERSVDVQIIRLRNKIEKEPSKPIYLQTRRGEGYVFCL